MQTAGQVENRLKQLNQHGQSIWLDFIQRSFLNDGELKKLVEEDGLRGVTSNPSIFEKAIAGSDDYKEELSQLALDRSLDANAIYESLAKEDIKEALTVLKGVYTETAARDGYVSMEVSPLIASDTEATISEAERLWQEIDRPNLMIKVPATDEGIPAIKHLISKGINVNVTLLFSCESYKKVAEAYIEGLEELASSGGDLSKVSSVASFFVSRIDSKIDKLLEEVHESAEEAKDKNQAKHLLGKVAIANAKMAYQIYRELFTSERWKELVSKGARPQRLLWASTSTKNPDYKDTLYVDELVGNETVNTLPLNTLNAFREHGVAQDVLEKGVEEAKEQLTTLEGLDISLEQVTETLLEEGVESFAKSFKSLLETVESVRKELLPQLEDGMVYSLSESIASKVEEEVKEWAEAGKVNKLWNKEASVWTSRDEANWLDWLHISEEQVKDLEKFESLKEEISGSDIEHVLLLGMGGSSLCPDVMSITFGKQEGFPSLKILDSTSPDQVKARLDELELAKTIFVVASKSGTTLEPNIFMSFYLEKMKEEIGDGAGTHFVAITDPGSKLEEFARENGFKHIFYGLPQIGGRYSALSDFGMIPATLMGVDVNEFLSRTNMMVDSCKESSSLHDNPGVMLGIILGVAHNQGQDKLTILTSKSLSSFGAWLEQLIAESTGKEGKAIIPVDREEPGAIHVYSKDRVFLYVHLDGDENIDEKLDELKAAGYTVIRIDLKEKMDLGREFFRFEIATSVAGAIMGINPFDQPDVEASKVATRALTNAYEAAGSLPPETAVLEEGAVKVFLDEDYKKRLELTEGESLSSILNKHFDTISESDYFGLLGYIHMNSSNEECLTNLRHKVRDAKHVATCLGFGPRFLHSTGQAYKGGPNTGVFLQFTSDHEFDLDVPGHNYSFGVVIDAQARGDLEVLCERKRRVVRLHLSNVEEGLKQLESVVSEILSQ